MGLCSEVADDGENLEDHPVLAGSYVRRKASVSACILPGKYLSAALNLFHSVQTYFLPGTLHHSGNRPAPPSEDTPLARRSAFCARKPGRGI